MSTKAALRTTATTEPATDVPGERRRFCVAVLPFGLDHYPSAGESALACRLTVFAGPPFDRDLIETVRGAGYRIDG
jgi:hypothetical protein